jgi:ADP-dependent NAD(P)H-hydrate dehydratase / NAD(P)H-hydrate epimerase
MIPILTPTESAALDAAAAARGVTVDDLMERAGRAVARTALRVAGGGYGRRAVVVCGKGNNGGDGLVAARHLARWGMGVSVVLLADAGSLRGAAGSTFARFAATGGRWKPFETEFLRRELDRSDVAVDAIFGTGFRGAPEGDFAAAIDSLGPWWQWTSPREWRERPERSGPVRSGPR